MKKFTFWEPHEILSSWELEIKYKGKKKKLTGFFVSLYSFSMQVASR